MTPSRSSIVVALWLALLVPTAVTGQEPAVDSLALEDGTRDLHEPSGVEPSGDLPAYADLTDVTVSVDAGRLTVRFDTAEAVPEDPDPSALPVAYKLDIDTGGDANPEYEVYVGHNEEGWFSSVFDIYAAVNTPLDGEVNDDGSVTTSVGLDVLPAPTTEMRFAASSSVYDQHDPDDILDVTIWEDRVPDDEDEWRALGEADAVATPDVASPEPSA